MSFTITIEQTSRELVPTHEYEVIRTTDDGDKQYGYVDGETTKDVERTIYVQRVGDLDLVSVINAVNKVKD